MSKTTPKPLDLLKLAVRLMDKHPEMEFKHADHVRHIRARYHRMAELQKKVI